jgi:hypothetical protein
VFDTTQELDALEGVAPQDVLDAYDSGDQETYQDATGPVPPPTGNYELKIEKSTLKKNKDGQPILDDGKFPIFVIQSATIVGASNFPAVDGDVPMGGGLGEGTTRKVGLLYDVRTKPFERGGHQVSNFVDLLRSFDVSRARFTSFKEGLETLADLINQGATFRARLDWTAEDYEARNEELKKYGETTAEQKERLTQQQYNAIYAKYRVTSMHKFPKRPNGGYDGIWTSPSGKPVEARLKIVRFYPSIETVRLGGEGKN